jgi:hypothetical protein
VKGSKIVGGDYVTKLVPARGVHLGIGENTHAIAREHQARIEELPNAQQASSQLLSRPGFDKTSRKRKRI